LLRLVASAVLAVAGKAEEEICTRRPDDDDNAARRRQGVAQPRVE
jgi:hypothetical protein